MKEVKIGLQEVWRDSEKVVHYNYVENIFIINIFILGDHNKIKVRSLLLNDIYTNMNQDQKVIISSMGQILLVDNEKYSFFDENQEKIPAIIKKSISEELSYGLRKHPNIKKAIINSHTIEVVNSINKWLMKCCDPTMITSQSQDINSIILDSRRFCIQIQRVCKKYNESRQLLKQVGFNIMDYNLSNIKKLENLEDDLENILLKHREKKFLLSFVSKKYRFLLNEESYIIVAPIYKKSLDDNLNHEIMNKIICKKISAFTNSNEFNAHLKWVSQSLGKWNVLQLVESIKSKGLNKNIIKVGTDYLVLKVDNFKECEELGSKNWCISRSETYFKQYQGKYNIQYIIYDLSKENHNNLSMIGVTIKPNGKAEAAHLKDDSHAHHTKYSKWQKFLFPINKDVLYNDFLKLENTNEIIKLIIAYIPDKLAGFLETLETSKVYLEDRSMVYVIAASLIENNKCEWLFSENTNAIRILNDIKNVDQSQSIFFNSILLILSLNGEVKHIESLLMNSTLYRGEIDINYIAFIDAFLRKSSESIEKKMKKIIVILKYIPDKDLVSNCRKSIGAITSSLNENDTKFFCSFLKDNLK